MFLRRCQLSSRWRHVHAQWAEVSKGQINLEMNLITLFLLHVLRHILNESLVVVYSDSQILVLLQDVDDLILQRQILLHLRAGDVMKQRKTQNTWEHLERDHNDPPAHPSAAASCSAPAHAHSSSRWRTPETPARTPRMHLGCRGPREINDFLLHQSSFLISCWLLMRWFTEKVHLEV